jgi:hypothetical protein
MLFSPSCYGAFAIMDPVMALESKSITIAAKDMPWGSCLYIGIHPIMIF